MATTTTQRAVCFKRNEHNAHHIWTRTVTPIEGSTIGAMIERWTRAGTCAGLTADDVFERTMDACS